MFCVNCGQEIPEESTFCIRCGTKVLTSSDVGTGRLIVAACAAMVSVLFAMMSLYGDKWGLEQQNLSGSSVKPSSSASPAADTSPPLTILEPAEDENRADGLQSKSRNIINRTVRLKPNGFQSFRFEVEEGLSNPRLSGEVNASGGGKDDVYIIVVDESGLREFRQGKGYATIYQSRVVDSKEIRIPLTPGIYHLILSNVHARFYTKMVNAKIALESD